jgi:hypothetical protein
MKPIRALTLFDLLNEHKIPLCVENSTLFAFCKGEEYLRHLRGKFDRQTIQETGLYAISQEKLADGNAKVVCKIDFDFDGALQMLSEIESSQLQELLEAIKQAKDLAQKRPDGYEMVELFLGKDFLISRAYEPLPKNLLAAGQPHPRYDRIKNLNTCQEKPLK